MKTVLFSSNKFRAVNCTYKLKIQISVKLYVGNIITFQYQTTFTSILNQQLIATGADELTNRL